MTVRAERAQRQGRSEQHFEAAAATWLARYERRASFRVRLRMIAAAIERTVGPGATVLDVGSGPGLFGAVASERAAFVVCLDNSPAMLFAGKHQSGELERLVARVARRYHPEKVGRVAGSLSALSSRASSYFDVVIAAAVLEYQHDVFDFVGALLRVVRPGGRLILTVPNASSALRRIERPLDRIGALAGKVTGTRRLIDRDYSALRPHGSVIPWRAAIEAASGRIVEEVRLPLGDAWLGRGIAPSTLVVATRRAGGSL